jgi:GNAT superfamily N-acetyltransferase
MAQTFESRVLHRENGLVYSVATAARRDQIVRILSESFRREPMSSALGVSAGDLAPLTELFMPECTTNGLSVVAVPEDEPETVAGVFISRDFKSPLPDGVPGDFPWFLPIAEALGSVDAAYEAQRPDLAPGDAVDLWMVGVAAPKFVRRGIANTLFELCIDVARERGFERCVTECTGHYSQSAARRAGFDEVARLAYRDFRFEGRAVFAAVPAPHTHLVLYEKKL